MGNDEIGRMGKVVGLVLVDVVVVPRYARRGC